jgi:hypothetical protein
MPEYQVGRNAKLSPGEAILIVGNVSTIEVINCRTRLINRMSAEIVEKNPRLLDMYRSAIEILDQEYQSRQLNVWEGPIGPPPTEG